MKRGKMSGVEARSALTATPLMLQIEGAASTCLSGQSMANVWSAGRHSPAERLGVLEVKRAQLAPWALERVTWMLLCWPNIDEVLLDDKRLDRIVGRVRRCAAGGRRGVAERAYRWRGIWLQGDGDATTFAEPAGPVDAFPPSARRRLWGLPARVFDTGASSVAWRERVKCRLQQAFGRGTARMAHRGYQWVADRWRSRQLAEVCPVNALSRQLAALAAVPRNTSRRVLIVVSRLDPGGAERNIIDLAVRLSRQDWQVHVMTTTAAENRWAVELEEAGIELLSLPDFLPPHCWTGYLLHFIATRAIAVLHVMNSHWAYQQLPLIRALRSAPRVVTQLHAEGEPGLEDFPTLAARFDAYVDVHTVISQHLSARMVDTLQVPQPKVRLIRSGIGDVNPVAGVAPRADWRSEHGVSAQRPIVIFVGRFSELKRPLLFLDIAARVARVIPDVLFVIKGHGPLGPVIRRRLAQYPSLRMNLVIEDAAAPVPVLMRAADLLVLPSLMEGIAYVSYEAMSHGLPQVYADVGGQSELLGDACGVPVARGAHELDAYVAAVVYLLQKPERRRQMGEAALRRLREWPTADDTAAAYACLYAELTVQTTADRDCSIHQ